MSDKLTEYEFTLPNGEKRYEFCASMGEVFRFQRMHGSISAYPLKRGTTEPEFPNRGEDG